MSAVTPKKMKVSDLRDALAARNFAAPSKWLKDQLVQKLEELINAETTSASASASSSSSSTSTLSSSSSSASSNSQHPTEPQNAAPADSVDSSPPVVPATPAAAASSTNSISSSSTLAKLAVDPAESLTDKKRKRAEKFGIALIQSPEEKFEARAAKFGSQTPKKSKTDTNDDEASKLAARAAKWGTAALPTAEDEEKKRARSLKFSGLSEDEKAKLAARAAKFASSAPVAPGSKTIALPANPAAASIPRASDPSLDQDKLEKRKAKFAVPL